MTAARLDEATVVARLRAAGCVFAEDEARLLMDAAATPAELAALVDRRVAGVPLEHVLGWAEFCGLRIAVDPGVFVPRRRTEVLVREAASLARARGGRGRPLLRLGRRSGRPSPPPSPGSSCTPPTSTRSPSRAPGATWPAAAGCTRATCSTRCRPALRGRVDVLVANVPYVPERGHRLMPPEAREHEPRVALDGGARRPGRRPADRRRGTRLAGAGRGAAVRDGERQASAAVDVVAGSGLRARVVTDDELGATVVVGTRRVRSGLPPSSRHRCAVASAPR